MHPILREAMQTEDGRVALSAALMLIAGDHTPINKVTAIAINRVLSTGWAPQRSERIEAAYNEGITLPPIHVISLRLNKNDRWYGVSDGNHRAEVARRRGRRLIRALVREEALLNPNGYRFDKDMLIEYGGPGLRMDMGECSDRQRALLEALGVRARGRCE